MADNVALPGTGQIVHADEFTDSIYGLGKSQQFKLADGTPNSSNKAKVSAAGALLVTDDVAPAIYRGRAASFSTPGRAGAAGQKLFSMYNAAASGLVVTIESIFVDLTQGAVIAVTVRPVVIRVYRVTVAPTNGTAVTKVALDSSLAPSGSVTVLADSSADGTLSASALTATLPAGNILTQTYAARLITAAGYEPFDRETFFGGSGDNVVLRPGEGIVVMLDYTLATQNPSTNQWIVTTQWLTT